jgi:hypothetical protein
MGAKLTESEGEVFDALAHKVYNFFDRAEDRELLSNVMFRYHAQCLRGQTFDANDPAAVEQVMATMGIDEDQARELLEGAVGYMQELDERAAKGEGKRFA